MVHILPERVRILPVVALGVGILPAGVKLAGMLPVEVYFALQAGILQKWLEVSGKVRVSVKKERCRLTSMREINIKKK